MFKKISFNQNLPQHFNTKPAPSRFANSFQSTSLLTICAAPTSNLLHALFESLRTEDIETLSKVSHTVTTIHEFWNESYQTINKDSSDLPDLFVYDEHGHRINNEPIPPTLDKLVSGIHIMQRKDGSFQRIDFLKALIAVYKEKPVSHNLVSEYRDTLLHDLNQETFDTVLAKMINPGSLNTTQDLSGKVEIKTITEIALVAKLYPSLNLASNSALLEELGLVDDASIPDSDFLIKNPNRQLLDQTIFTVCFLIIKPASGLSILFFSMLNLVLNPHNSKLPKQLSWGIDSYLRLMTYQMSINALSLYLNITSSYSNLLVLSLSLICHFHQNNISHNLLKESATVQEKLLQVEKRKQAQVNAMIELHKVLFGLIAILNYTAVLITLNHAYQTDNLSPSSNKKTHGPFPLLLALTTCHFLHKQNRLDYLANQSIAITASLLAQNPHFTFLMYHYLKTTVLNILEFMIGNYFKMEDVINMNQETPPSNIQTFLIQSVVKSLNKKELRQLMAKFHPDTTLSEYSKALYKIATDLKNSGN